MISARKGEFETGYERGGQTREHVQLAKTLGVSKLLVVVNKMDDPTVNWSKERYFSWISSVCAPFVMHEYVSEFFMLALCLTVKRREFKKLLGLCLFFCLFPGMMKLKQR